MSDFSTMADSLGLVHDPKLGGWRVVGHATAKQALTEPRLDVVPNGAFSERLRSDAPPSPREFLASWFSRQAPSDHQATKRGLVRAYSRSRVVGFTEEIREHAVELAAGLPEECDLVCDFFRPLVLRSMACTIGLPLREVGLLEKVTQAIANVLARPVFDAPAARAIETTILVLRRFVDYLFELAAPPPSVQALKDIAADEERGGMWNAVSTLAHVLSAGLHPTISGAAFAWIQCHSEPSVREALDAGHLSVSDVASEALRLCPPFPVVHRWAQEDFEFAGNRLEKGHYVCIDLEAANRDPAVFREPDQVRRRDSSAHNLAFGHGPHRCVGVALARVQIEVALECLMAQERPLTLAGSPTISGKEGFGRLVEVRAIPCRRLSPQRSAADTPETPPTHSMEMEGGVNVQ